MNRQATRAELAYAAELLALGAAYVVAGRLGLAMSHVGGFASLVWPPTALSLVALVIGECRLWPAVALGAVVTNVWMGAPPLVACGMGVGNTLEAVAGAFMLRSIPGFHGSLDRFKEVVGLGVVGALAGTISATVGVASLALGGVLPEALRARTWLAWWTGDMMGVYILAPALFTWAAGARLSRCSHARAEAAALGAFLIAAGALVCFSAPQTVARVPILQPYVLFLPLLWAALRFGPKGAATCTLVVAAGAIGGSYAGHGAFVRADRTESLAAVHVFLGTISLASLALGAVVCEREQSREELHDSEERQRLAVEAANIGMWFWDLGTDRLAWTPLCRSIHGIGPDEDVTVERLIAALHPDDRERTEREMRRAIADRTEYRIEHRVVWPDGSVHWVSVLGRALQDRGGEPERMLGVAIDVTAQKRAEQERAGLLERERAALAEARAATRAKDDFLAVLSHELRTPLQAMLGWTQMLRARACDAGTVERGLATIERNARTQARLIEDLLDVSRIVAGKLRLEHRRVELGDVVTAAIESARSAADVGAIRIEATIDPSPVAVLGDPVRLQQIALNLLTNAVKFTPRGGRIRVRLDRDRTAARIVVEDDGRGIAPDFLPYVFDRFRQEEGGTTRRQGGLGLGLSIVRSLVELHGGTVTAESPGEGRGATFTVTLPIASAEPSAVEAARAGEGPAVLGGVRVLVVDDDPDARELIEIALHEAGAEVHAVPSVRAAVGEFGAFHPDLLLSDIGMPEEDGYALIREVRRAESGGGGHIPAVALTAFASPADREQALALGFDAHLAKPANAGDLARLAASLVGRAA